MVTEASSVLFAGLDLHSSNVFCGIKDKSGAIVFRRRLPNDLTTILQMLEGYRAQLKGIAVESTFNWYWLVDGLQEAGYHVHLASPAQMEAYSGVKHTNDESDALWLAEMLRLDILPEGYIYPKEMRPVRDMLRRRSLVTRQATQTLLSLESMVARHTAQTVKASVLEKWTLKEVNETFADPCSQKTALALLELLGDQRRIQHDLEESVLVRVKLCEQWERLLTLPGVGKILGITIILETGPIERFGNAGQYASYCRTVNSRCDSDGKKKGENNRKNGNKYLSWAYVEASNFAQRYNQRAKQWFDSKKSRTCRVVAVKALACKLAKSAYYVLHDNVEFDEKKMFG